MEYVKQPIPEYLRQLIFERDGYMCRYCGDKNGNFHADHVYPESRGGETSLQNLVTACASCNHQKWAHVGIWPLPIGFFNEPPKPISMIEALDKSYYDLLDRVDRIALSDGILMDTYVRNIAKIQEDYMTKRETYFLLEDSNTQENKKGFIERFLAR